MDEPTASNPPKARSPGRWWRWSRNLVLLLLGLVIAIAICLQILLWTDIPRRMVLQKLQTTLGLRVEASTVDIGWSGHTTLEHVQISLPLAQQSFLEIARLDVTHTSIPMIMLTQDVTLKDAVFHQPTLLVAQDKQGQWNVAEAMDLITRAAGKKQAQEQPAQSSALPAVTIEDGTVTLMDRNGRTAKIQPLSVQGAPQGPLVWKYQARVPDRMMLTGEVSPGGDWEHDLAFDVHDIGPWLSAWMQNPPDLKTAGTWHGDVEGSKIDGQIRFDQLAVGTLNLQGSASVQRVESGEVTVSPKALMVQTANRLAPNVTIHDGALVLAATSASARDLAVSIAGGEAKLNGSYSWAEKSGNLSAAWRDIEPRPGVTTAGSVDAKMTMPWPGAPRIEADLTSTGHTSAGSWDSKISLAGDGRAWNSIDWTANISRIAWSGRRSVALSDLKLAVSSRPDRITLQSISIGGGAEVNGSGAYSLADGSWHLNLDGTKIPVQRMDLEPVAFHLRASGADGRVKLDELAISSGQIDVHADGSYDSHLPKPVVLDVDLSHLPPLQGAREDAAIRGRLYGKASLSGTVSPLQIGIDHGMLYGSNVVIGNQKIGELAIQLSGDINETEALVETTEAEILGGHWRLRGEWPGPGTPLELFLRVRQLPLSQVGTLLRKPGISGSLDGAWEIEIPAADSTRITARGQSDIRDVAVGKFKADRVITQSKFEDGMLTLDPVQFQYGSGSAAAHLDLAIREPTHVNLTADVKQWPVAASSGNAAATISAQTQLALDLSKKAATGPVTAQMAFVVNGQNAGTLSLESSLAGRMIKLTKLEASALNGTVSGSGILPLDDINQATATLSWKDLDAAKVAAFFPKMQDLTGTLSGSADMTPTNDPRAIGPLKIAINLAPTGLRFRAIEIGSAQLSSYLTGERRFVLDESTLHAAGGDVHLWARTTRHYKDIRSSQIQIDFTDLDLNQLDASFDTKPKPMPGKLAGNFVIIGWLQDRDTLFGQGSVKVTQSNLVNLGAIRGLYNVMHIGQDDTGTEGTGGVDLRLDNNTLTLTRGRYFNHGIQVRALATIENIWNAPDSPITGTVIGSARPLRDIKLPYFADADKIMNALQQNLTTVRIEGTLREYHVVPISLYEAGETVQKLLLGEVQKK